MELRWNQGLCNLFRRFVLNSNCAGAQLNDKLDRSQPQTFEGISEGENIALERLKAKLVKTLVFALPRSLGSYNIHMDDATSILSVSCYRSYGKCTNWILCFFIKRCRASMRHDGQWMTCSSMCSVTSSNELRGRQLTISTDGNALKCIFNLTDSTESLERLRLQLSELDCDFVPCAGIEHQAADVLSWLKTTRADQALIKDEIAVLCITTSIRPKIERRGLCIGKTKTYQMTENVLCYLQYTRFRRRRTTNTTDAG